MNTRCPARHPGGLLGDKGGEERGPGKPGRASAAQPSVPQPVATGATRTIDALATGVTKRPGPNLALRTEDELSQALGWNFSSWAGTPCRAKSFQPGFRRACTCTPVGQVTHLRTGFLKKRDTDTEA